MSQQDGVYCPECQEEVQPASGLDRRDFLRMVGAGVAGGIAAGAAPGVLSAADAPPKSEKPAEALVKELYAGLSSEQRRELVLPWDHGKGKGDGDPKRLGMYNSALEGLKIGEKYTKAQQDLNHQILRAICSDDDGYSKISRGGTFDGSKAFENCGALIFGEPTDGKQFTWLFTGHHITVRCDGNSEPGAAFGGPLYYGHSPNGYSDKNLFNYQTKGVLAVFDALNENQRKKAVVVGSPGESEESVRFRAADKMTPGIAHADLTEDQRKLVTEVMRNILSPFRKEDVDEVMQIIKATGGLEKIHLAFYQDKDMKDSEKWHFWRLEGPGFVWNYRVLPHVHTYVSISSKTA